MKQELDNLKSELEAANHKTFLAQTSTTLLGARLVGRDLTPYEVELKKKVSLSRQRIVKAKKLLALAANDMAVM